VRLKQARSVRVLELRLERFQVLLVSEGHFSQLQINCNLRASALNGFGVSLPLTLKSNLCSSSPPLPATHCGQKPRACLKTNEPVPRTHLSENKPGEINLPAAKICWMTLRIDGFSYHLSVSTLNPTSAAAPDWTFCWALETVHPTPLVDARLSLLRKSPRSNWILFGARHGLANLGYPGLPNLQLPEQPGSASPCVSMNTVIHTLNGQSLASQITAAAGTGDNGRLRLPAAPSVGRHAGGDAEDIFRRDEKIAAQLDSEAITLPNMPKWLTPDRTAFGGEDGGSRRRQRLRKAEIADANFHISVGARVIPTLTRLRAKPIIQLHSGKFPRSRKLLPMVAQDARNFERIFGFWSGSSEPKCGFENWRAPPVSRDHQA